MAQLTKVIHINFFATIRQNFDKSMDAGCVCSCLDQMTEVEEVDSRIFELFLSWLKFVDKSDKFNNILTDAFIINLFSVLGFYPILDYCVICEKTYKEMAKDNLLNNKKLGFYFAGGGIICPLCREEKKHIGEQIVDCGLREVSNLQALLKNDWRLIQDFSMEEVEQKKLHKLIYEFVLFHSEKKIEDWELHLNI